MLQQAAPDDYVIATGRQFSVRDFVQQATKELGISIDWIGSGLSERAIVTNRGEWSALRNGQEIVHVDPRYFRPAEVETLLGDASKARTSLGWEPKTSFESLVREMVEANLSAAERDRLVEGAGYRAMKFAE